MIARSPRELATWLLGPDHLDALDEEGRPLGEVASRRYAEAPRREAVRRFGDARDETGLPCNLAALGQLRRSWPTLLHALSAYEADRPATAARALRRAMAGTLLAPTRSLSGAIDREAAALFKVSLGYSELLAAALMEGELDADAPLPGPHHLCALLASRPWLIGEAQVCAGSRKQIAEAWAALGADAREPSGVLGWHALSPVVDAALELSALSAVAAGAARVHVAHGAREDGRSACVALLSDDQAPRFVRALGQIADGGPLHPTLLFAADHVPASVRALIESLPAPGALAAFARIDEAWRREAGPAEARLAALSAGGARRSGVGVVA